MHKYFLFLIADDMYDLYLNNPYILYKTLDNLYRIKGENINYGVSLYKQICKPFNVPLLNNYLIKKENIRKYNNLFYYKDKEEKTMIEVNYSSVIIITSKNLPKCLEIFGCYNKKIFVVDFYNKEFFWLEYFYHIKKVHEYNTI